MAFVEGLNMIHIPHIITDSFVKQHPDWIFIYGDNLIHKGEEGHRILFSHLPNCYPVPTKKRPCHREDSYFNDKEYFYNEKHIKESIDKIPFEYTFVVLIQGIGKEEDDSMLYIKAPGTYNYLIQDELDRIKSQYIIDYPTGI